ncbi:MAG: hypothetical protein H7A23_17330 [Leptospiraceae bacterium]|nr:hypothetical protein [Leptospiraceae bacterium]MCP5496311.1 hypothetical protein [Leptospiraceae bacterium]
MRKLFFALSVFLFFVALAIHSNSYIDFIQPESMEWAFVVHIMVFLVFVPGILYTRKDFRMLLENSKTDKSVWDVIKKKPKPLAWFTPVILIYAIGNFFLSMAQGQTLRGFSGHWLLFFYASILMLYPVNLLTHGESKDNVEKLTNKEESDFQDKFLTIRKPPLSVWYRATRDIKRMLWLFGANIVLLLLIGYFAPFYLMVIPLFLLVMFLNIGYYIYQSKIYITQFSASSTQISIGYLNFDKETFLRIPLDSLYFSYSILMYKGKNIFVLAFYDGNEMVLKMKGEAGEWTRPEMEKVSNFLKTNYPDRERKIPKQIF